VPTDLAQAELGDEEIEGEVEVAHPEHRVQEAHERKV
jgi:hypothetical protein